MQNKTEKQGFWQNFKRIPYWTMNKYVKSQDNTQQFQTMYSKAWFVALLAMFVLSIVCFWVDYNVLYGIEYTSSLDRTQSFYSAIGSATVIQFLIVLCGGLFFKIIIWGKLRNPAEAENGFFASIDQKHLFQCIVFGTLFIYGFAWTIDLSNKTYFSAKANALGNETALEQNYKSDLTALNLERQSKIKELERTANKTIKSKENHYNNLIASVVAKYDAKKAKYEADSKRYNRSKATVERYLAKYDYQAEQEKAPLLIQKEKALAPILASLSADIEAIRATYNGYEKSLDYKASSNRSELSRGIEATARETQGRNVKYNLVNVILMFGLLLFAKHSIDDTAAPTGSDDDTQTDEHTPQNTAYKADDNTDSNTGHATDTQPRNTAKNKAKKHKKQTVTTDEHSETQHKVGDYIEFENLEDNTDNTVSYFKQDGYEFKKQNGIVSIKHGKAYATLNKLNTWKTTYNQRVDKYTREHKNNLARKNAQTAAIISQKINYLKEHFVYARNKPTTEDKQAGHLRTA